ncbi:ankyrin repeat-containing domain protein, partial [Baffinella frigidus]
TMLMKASQYGALDVIRMLIEKGASVHARDALGEQALHWAVRHCQPHAVHLLIRCGADVSASNVQ